MIVYRYSATTGEYIGEHLCQINPLEGGYLTPPDCTEIAPPEAEGKYASWTGAAWELLDDNSGVWYDTETGHAVYIFERKTAPTGCTRIPMPDLTYSWSGTEWIVDPAKVTEQQNQYLLLQLSESDQRMIRKLDELYLKLIENKVLKKNDFYDPATGKNHFDDEIERRKILRGGIK